MPKKTSKKILFLRIILESRTHIVIVFKKYRAKIVIYIGITKVCFKQIQVIA